VSCSLKGLKLSATGIRANVFEPASARGILGNRYRVKYVTTGTYNGNTTLQIDAQFVAHARKPCRARVCSELVMHQGMLRGITATL
jgi:hypothetical protein